MKPSRVYLILLVSCLVCIQSEGQQTKSPVQLADQYYASGDYYTAAHLYGQYLNPSKKQKPVMNFPVYSAGKRKSATTHKYSRLEIRLKQAESYRLANYWKEAAVAYKECAAEDVEAYAIALYWYAVCERSLGNYASAEQTLKRYLSLPGINQQDKQSAEKELQTLKYIQHQLARPDSVLIKIAKLSGPKSNETGMFALAHLSGSQFLLSSTQKDSVATGGSNPYHSRLFFATLNSGSVEKMTPVELSTTDPMNHQGAACFSADGNYLYFSQWKTEKGRTLSSIYYSVKQAGAWSEPILVQSMNVSGYSSKQPFCSKDGKYIYFSSDRPNGVGNFDIWYAVLKNDGTTGEPMNAGSVINTNGDEQSPFYHNSSSTLVFSSNGLPGMGGYDLYAAKGRDGSWKSPGNLGHPVNSSRDDIYFSASETGALLGDAIFSSDRGTGCCLESYRITKEPKNKRLTGVLQDCADATPVADADIILKDVSGKTWEAKTDRDGKYIFNLKQNFSSDVQVSIKKALYNDFTSASNIVTTDETDLLVDVLINADLCIEKSAVVPPVEEKLVIKAENVSTVYFDFDKSSLNNEALAILDSISNVLIDNPSATVQISGYTDGLGKVEYNNKLSDKRARACGNYLIQKGIDPGRVTFVSFGACCPVEMEIINGRDNSDGRSRNRRALLNIDNPLVLPKGEK